MLKLTMSCIKFIKIILMILMHHQQRFSNNKIAAGLDQYSISCVSGSVLRPLHRVRNKVQKSIN